MESICKKIRKDILYISKISGHGHIPTCFSIVEILYAIYDSMKHNAKNPTWEQRDIFILSKGHAALAHYCTLARFGYFNIKRVESYGAYKSDFGCHVDRMKVRGVEVSTGSLGHGIGVGVGIALAFKIAQSPRQVFVLIGDGESNEGSVWEAIMVAADQKLNNLTIFYDDNKSQQRCLMIRNPAERFKAFECDVYEVDGHDVQLLKDAISIENNGVKVIVADTQKGFGSKTLENNFFSWHRRSPNEEEYKTLLDELNA